LKEVTINTIMKRYAAPLVPYITLGLGLLVWRNAWVALVGYHVLMLAIVFFSREHFDLPVLVRSANMRLTLIAALGGLLAGVLLYLFWPLLAVPSDLNAYLRTIGLAATAWPFFIAYFVVLNPWIEEYYWRFFLGSDRTTPIVNDLFFAGYHVMVLAGKIDVVWLVTMFVVLIVAAWAWRQLNRLSHGLLPSLLSHQAADITIILTIYLLAVR
jgi:hypothetical protein